MALHLDRDDGSALSGLEGDTEVTVNHVGSPGTLFGHKVRRFWVVPNPETGFRPLSIRNTVGNRDFERTCEIDSFRTISCGKKGSGPKSHLEVVTKCTLKW
jgi:hypothetical protein